MKNLSRSARKAQLKAADVVQMTKVTFLDAVKTLIIRAVVLASRKEHNAQLVVVAGIATTPKERLKKYLHWQGGRGNDMLYKAHT